MATTRMPSSHPNLTRCDSTDSVLSTITVDASSSNAQSLTSTPPTSAADSASISSASLKLESATTDFETDADTDEPNASNARPRRTRTSMFGTYNVKALSGTAVHAPKKFRKGPEALGEREVEVLTRRRTVSGDTLVGTLGSGKNASTETVVKEANRLVRDGIAALDLQWSVKGLPKSRSMIGLGMRATPNSPKKRKSAADLVDASKRRSTRSSGEQVESFTKKLSVLGKRGRNAFEASLAKGKRELKRLVDTNEYVGIETKPVLYEVWSNGKLVTGDEPAAKKAKVEIAPALPKVKEPEPPAVEKKKPKKRSGKVWLAKGLYAGQDINIDWISGYKESGKMKEIVASDYKPNKSLPLPMWQGQRLLHVGRDFKLPFDVCSPLPPGQPKPDEWKKFSKNRFVGDAAAAWKKSTLFDDFSSRCVCSSQGICGDFCQNRIMLYECDDANCSAGREQCTNRSFAALQERRSKGGKYRIGVEVIKTADRGYGVRTNRCFDANQIIVEYAGEIITEEECDRRMNEDYKENECYYLMSFDQNMIIDGTRGSIARFVNHSCDPNCRIVKWIVAGKPRMALFAGDRPLMTGEELTYDYNFDPFSAKNVQECRCGAKNCRGILGPRPKDHKAITKAASEVVGNAVKRAVSAGKRKLKELLAGEEDNQGQPKKRKTTTSPKRKIATPSKMKRSSSGKALKIAKTVSKKISKTVKRGNSLLIKKTSKTVKTYGKDRFGKRQTVLSSRNSSLTIVANDEASPKGAQRQKGKKRDSMGKDTLKKNVVRSIKVKGLKELGMAPNAASMSTIRVISIAGEEEA